VKLLNRLCIACLTSFLFLTGVQGQASQEALLTQATEILKTYGLWEETQAEDAVTAAELQKMLPQLLALIEDAIDKTKDQFRMEVNRRMPSSWPEVTIADLQKIETLCQQFGNKADELQTRILTAELRQSSLANRVNALRYGGRGRVNLLKVELDDLELTNYDGTSLDYDYIITQPQAKGLKFSHWWNLQLESRPNPDFLVRGDWLLNKVFGGSGGISLRGVDVEAKLDFGNLSLGRKAVIFTPLTLDYRGYGSYEEASIFRAERAEKASDKGWEYGRVFEGAFFEQQRPNSDLIALASRISSSPYERWAFGGQSSIYFNSKASGGISLISITDDSSRGRLTGSAPMANRVVSIDGLLSGPRGISLDGELAMSRYDQDVLTDTIAARQPAIEDRAWTLGLAIPMDRFTLEAKYNYVGPDYVALGAQATDLTLLSLNRDKEFSSLEHSFPSDLDSELFSNRRGYNVLLSGNFYQRSVRLTYHQAGEEQLLPETLVDEVSALHRIREKGFACRWIVTPFLSLVGATTKVEINRAVAVRSWTRQTSDIGVDLGLSRWTTLLLGYKQITQSDYAANLLSHRTLSAGIDYALGSEAGFLAKYKLVNLQHANTQKSGRAISLESYFHF
jgi:hypothetical protein